MKCRILVPVLGTLLSAFLFAASQGEAAETKKSVRVFVLAGQPNMEGKAKMSLLEYHYPYHYLGSAKGLCRIGKACAEAVLELRPSGN